MAERFTRSRRLSPTSSLVVCGMCVLPSFYFTSCSYIFLTTFTFIAFVVAFCCPPSSSSPYQRDRKRKRKRLIKFRSKWEGTLLQRARQQQQKDEGKIETIKPTK
jgi:hypothetical protein